MNEDQEKRVRQIIREELVKLIPEFFGRSILQIKQFFISNIK